MRIGRIRLGDLALGQWRFLRADEPSETDTEQNAGCEPAFSGCAAPSGGSGDALQRAGGIIGHSPSMTTLPPTITTVSSATRFWRH